MEDRPPLKMLAAAIHQHNIETEMAAWLHIHTTPLPIPTQPDWQTPVIITLGIIVILRLSYQIFFPYIHKFINHGRLKQLPNTAPESTIPEPITTCRTAEPDTRTAEPSPAVRYLQH
jgi:hypothetical protein